MATITVWSDIGCPWAHLAVHGLLEARDRLGAGVVLAHRPFPLELANRRPTSWSALSAEVPVVAGLRPDAGWTRWKRPPWEWPVTMLPALEAVQAATARSAVAGERLDRALRLAFFAESRCVSLRHVILDVAAGCPEVDAERLAADLDSGRARSAVTRAWAQARESGVPGSPYLVLPDGTTAFNPGVEFHWPEPAGERFPVVDRFDPGMYDELVRRAATGRRSAPSAPAPPSRPLSTRS